ncbi:hypothetical protein [Ruania halotolerans]|uniref:hypothetical protein n=1 Tax=Ruania halotolerans TaxID=2897773 RepID=UPI001E43CCB5|nr:hypothetical protein [Ruania halotolerans]UFU06879.1 hypothetical protein LQF10_01835 [Ruania halotolerans]
MGATKQVLRRLADGPLSLATDGIDTITGRMPVLFVGCPGPVLDPFADALHLAAAERYDPGNPPLFARTVAPRFRVLPAPQRQPGLQLHHAKRGTVRVWTTDERVSEEALQKGQALLVLHALPDAEGSDSANGMNTVVWAASLPVRVGWIDVLNDQH